MLKKLPPQSMLKVPQKDASDNVHSEVAEKAVQDLRDSGKEDTIKCTDTIDTAAAGTSAASGIQFKCDQCSYETASDKGVRQYIRMKHRISQLDGKDDFEVDSSDSVNNPGLLCQDYGYCVKRTCGNCEFKSSNEGLSHHIINAHEPKDVFKHFG